MSVQEAPALPYQAVTPDEIDAATEQIARTVARMKETILSLQAENERLRQPQTVPTPTPGSNKGSADLAALGITPEMAARIRGAFASFEDAWNAPGMEDYDDYHPACKNAAHCDEK